MAATVVGDHVPATYGHLRRLPITRSSGRTLYVKTEAIDWIEAANQYVRLHVGERKFILRESMGQLDRLLDPEVFFRIHRSAIVNLHRVRELQTESRRDHWVILEDGSRLRASKSRWVQLRATLTWG